MRVVILYNPKSGRGRGERVAEGIQAMLSGRGLVAELFATAKEPPEAFSQRLRAALAGADLLVVAGGDGTLHSTLPALLGSGVPVYHVAMGTENLFARQFGMDRLPETLDRAVAAWRVVDIDVGMLRVGFTEPKPFVLMCSLGPDASVIRRLDEVRKGAISHLSYFRPILAELLSPWLPRISVEVDGRRVVEGQRGMVVVANSRQYAVRLDPAYKATMTDGLLDMVFVPARGRLGTMSAFARFRFRKHVRGTVYVQGRAIKVLAEHPRRAALQVDGECYRVVPGPLALEMVVREKGLKVLVPGP